MNAHSLIHSAQDEYGEIKLFDDGQYRILSFAEGDEQSRIKIKSPHILQHEYTQAMLLPLLYAQPKRIAVLGLGGGTLIHTFNHHIPKVQIEAVELRHIVLEAAKTYFKLPINKRIQYHQANAITFVSAQQIKKVDFLMVDLYDSEGMDKHVLTESFLHDCYNNLKLNGWLVINCWIDNKHNEELTNNLKAHFANVLALDTGTGNWVILASNLSLDLTGKELKSRALKLSNDYEFAFNKWLTRIQTL